MLFDGPPLKPDAAVAALMVTPSGRYLLQHRDPLPGIFFPGWWGTFGGAMEPGEAPETTLRRELQEELAFVPDEYSHFTTLGLDFDFAGRGVLPRIFFEVPIAEDAPGRMTLGEGQDLALWSPAEIFGGLAVIPYDATAIWQHASRHRF